MSKQPVQRRKLTADVPITYRPDAAPGVESLQDGRFVDFIGAQDWTPERASRLVSLFRAKLRDLERAHASSPGARHAPQDAKAIPAGAIVDVIWAEERLESDQALLVQAADGAVGPVLRRDTELYA